MFAYLTYIQCGKYRIDGVVFFPNWTTKPSDADFFVRKRLKSNNAILCSDMIQL